ncbi:MAG: type II secretion system major pseudopilin GspG [Planctomycetes bacterium]|nr:type II secretion system major pseudopilin GspG [Planctomycetota bacterium]
MRSSFTLIEIMIVVVILGLLATVSVQQLMGRLDEAKIGTTKATLEETAQSIMHYKLSKGNYPSTEDGLESLKEGATPFLSKTPKDAWANPINYMYPGTKGPFDLWSFGQDGVDGGDGMDKDIYYNDEEEE